MIDKHVTLILGAGVSKPYGFPLDFDYSLNRLKEFVEQLENSQQPSLDAFLETRYSLFKK